MATPKTTKNNDMSCKEKKDIVAQKIIIRTRLAPCGMWFHSMLFLLYCMLQL